MLTRRQYIDETYRVATCKGMYRIEVRGLDGLWDGLLAGPAYFDRAEALQAMEKCKANARAAAAVEPTGYWRPVSNKGGKE